MIGDDDDNEQFNSIIPRIVLEAALAGKEISRNVKRRLYEPKTDSNVEVEESSDDERDHSKVKKSSYKQSSLNAFFTMPSSSAHWEPVHKQASAKKKTTVVRKKIAIDPPSTRNNKTSPVVSEISSNESDRHDREQQRLENSVLKAKKRSIKHYFKKGRENVTLEDPTKQTPKIEHKSNKRVRSETANCPDDVDKTLSGSNHSATSEIVEMDSTCETPNNGLIVDLEVQKTPSPSCHGLNEKLNKKGSQIKVSQTTPRRRLSNQRSFSPLHFFSDDEQYDFPKAAVIRRRRPCGEKSVFDLLSGGNVESIETVYQHSPTTTSTSPTVNVHEINSTGSSSAILDDLESDASAELYDTTTIPSTSTSDCFGEDRIKEKKVLSGSNSSDNHTSTNSADNMSNLEEEIKQKKIANIPYHSPPVVNIIDDDESNMKITSTCDDDIVLLETVQVSTPKSRSLSTSLYSPRKMELNNSQRLKAILSKAHNTFDFSPNLADMTDSDYCAFDVSSISGDKPPLSSPRTCEDTNLKFENPTEFIRLPWSTANIVSGFHHYIIIDRALRALVYDGAHCIEAVIVTLRECAPWLKSYNGLVEFLQGLSSTEERKTLDVIAGIAKLAVNAKFILTSPVPLLRANRSGTVTLSQEQCACLLAHAFFCTYRRERRSFNRINMGSIFDDRNPMCHVKLRFILHYFSNVLKKMPTGCVSFRREILSPSDVPNWKEDQSLMPLVATSSDSSIEDSHGCLQVDFANEYVGGGVLNWGAVQEEIRFLICPEMIVSCLLCEKMGPFEVIHIVGAQRHSSYIGYGETLQWVPYEEYDLEPRDEFCRVKCEVVAMDATLFKASTKWTQYDKINIDRELNKAYVGFMSKKRELPPIATGNWGCGVFGGDKEMKILIQMMAAARAGRDMIYYTFGNPSFEYCVIEQYEKMIHKKATVGTVYKAITSYQKEHERNPRVSLFDHVYAVLSEFACTAS